MDRPDCSFGTLGFHIPYWNRSRTGSSESDPSITTELEGIQPPPGSAKRKFQSCTVRDSQAKTSKSLSQSAFWEFTCFIKRIGRSSELGKG